ncbi:MAG: hypothetical protein HYR60_17435 [Acidobacteria bacterium]|nr:hypothetical protein [Acidobacteriota bacterium]
MEPPYGGVRQSGFEQLEQSLLELESIYSGGDRERAAACRRAVIQAKDHARLASRNPRTSEEKRKQKEEMVQWMLVWLENPGVFPAWVAIRKRRLGLTADRSPTP